MQGNPVVVKGLDGHYLDKRDGQIPENGFTLLENVYVTSAGTIKARPGLSTIGAANFRVGQLLGYWTKSDGTRRFIVNQFNGGALGVSILTEDGDTGTEIISGTSGELLLQWDDLAFIFGTGSTTIRTWDGAAAVNTTIDVQATVGITHKSRMFVVDNGVGDVNNSIIRYSEIFDLDAPNTTAGWPANNTLNIASEDGDIITAMAILNDTIIVFKRFSTWQVFVEGVPPWTVRNLHPTIGCIGRDTAIVIGGLLYFRAANGVYRTDGTTFELLSGPIKESLDDSPGMVYNECNQRSAVWWGDYYLLNDYTNGRSETWWECYNIENGAWSRFVFTGIQKFRAILDRETSPPTIYVLEADSAADTGNLQVFVETNDLDDAGVDIDCKIHSKMYDFDKPSEWKLLREVDFEFAAISPYSSQGFSFDVFNERQTGPSTQTDTLDWEQRSLARFRGPMRCRAARYELEFNPVQDMELNQVVFDLGVVGRVGEAR
jgi:hypothetical protein